MSQDYWSVSNDNMKSQGTFINKNVQGVVWENSLEKIDTSNCFIFRKMSKRTKLVCECKYWFVIIILNKMNHLSTLTMPIKINEQIIFCVHFRTRIINRVIAQNNII